MPATTEQVSAALRRHPSLKLLGSYSAHWVIPLFAKHLATSEESVSAEWFHERVAEATERNRQGQADTPSDYCRKWADEHWIDVEYRNERLRYRISQHSLRTLGFIEQLVAGESTVTAARFESIAHSVHSLALATNPDRDAQLEQIDEQIEQLRQRRAAIADGRARATTAEEQDQYLNEVLTMLRSMPADFAQLRERVESGHQEAVRRAMATGPTKAELVEDYLREHDLLAGSPEGRAYLSFAQLLASSQTEQLRADLDQILSQEFARTRMSTEQRSLLGRMIGTLLGAQHRVQSSYTRWMASLRRMLTRNVDPRSARLLDLTDEAFLAAADWFQREPGGKGVDIADWLGVGSLDVSDISQHELRTESGGGTVEIAIGDPHAEALPAADLHAMRIAALTSRRAVGGIINRLLSDTGSVSGARVFDAIPADGRNLGALVSLLDLGIEQGAVTSDADFSARVEAELGPRTYVLPDIVFEKRITFGAAHE